MAFGQTSRWIAHTVKMQSQAYATRVESTKNGVLIVTLAIAFVDVTVKFEKIICIRHARHELPEDLVLRFGQRHDTPARVAVAYTRRVYIGLVQVLQ